VINIVREGYNSLSLSLNYIVNKSLGVYIKMKIGKSDLRELVREVIREELNTRKYFKESVNVLDVSASEVDDLARDVYVDAEFDSAYETDRRTVGETVKALVVDVISSEYPNMDLGNVPDRVISALKNMLETGVLTESSLTAEEKIDAWHAGTRRENYKAAGIPKLQTFLDIAKRKGYTEIVNILEGELVRRGVTSSASAPTATTGSVSTSAAATSEVEPDVEVSATDPEEPAEPPHFSDELVKELEDSGLSDKEKDTLIGKAIEYLGKEAFYARSYWRTAMGFTGSYSTTWYNSNGNEVKPDRAKDRIRDLTYASDRLVVLRSHFDGGSRNIDRYYSIEIPSSTDYIVDTSKIRDMLYSSYYDSEIDWRVSTLTKTPTNRKKFKQYLIDTAGMPIDQAEELTTYAFDKRVW
jgi:hypothetical protein